MSETFAADFSSWMEDPEFKREFKRYKARMELAARVTAPLLHIPVIGRYIRDFWFFTITEHPVSVFKPRWGAITFAYLNDGWPTVWHTWKTITTPEGGDDPGIYVKGTPCGDFLIPGAPRSQAEADAWEAQWTIDRQLKRGEG